VPGAHVHTEQVRHRLLTFAAILLCVCAAAASPPGDRDVVARFEAQLDGLREAARIPGLAVVALRGTKVILARGFGYANVARSVPVTADTPFNIASVSKPISAIVALRLAEQGLLDLDRPMASYKGFEEFCADVRQGGGIFFRDYDCDRCPLTLRQVLSMEANGVPGTRFLYNPPSYSWASRPMAEASGVPFSQLTAELVFGPAGMTRSARIHRKLPLAPALAAQLATPYHLDAQGSVVASDPPPLQGDGAAGGVISTAMDLARFDIALSEGRLVAPGSRDAMWTAGRSPSGAVLPYGLGWFVQERGGEKLVWHAGLWDGAYSALYLKAPDRDLTLILLANSEGLKWDNGLDEAAVERSPFAAAFLEAFPR
jgi:CubicO group peptidase (beta-lactamase class C family)